MRFHNFLRSKQSLLPWLFPPKECLRSCLWLKFFQSFLCLHRSAMPQIECQAYFFCWCSLHIDTIMRSSSSGRKIFVCSLSPWLLVPHLCCVRNSCCSFSPGKHAWRFSNGSIPSDLRGFFVGGFSPSFTIRVDRGSNWGLPIRNRKKCQIIFI